MASRLFPFDRGIVHYYKAANVWALLVDICGVDQEAHLDNKFRCLLLTVVFLVPTVVAMIKKMDINNFLFYLALVNFISFNFGFHVHEKAALMMQVPLALTALQDDVSKLRFKVITLNMVWTLLPLFPLVETIGSLPVRL